MMRLSTEEKIVLLCCRRSLSDKEAGEIKRLAGPDGSALDYRELVRIAGRNEVAPLVYRNLESLLPVTSEEMRILRKSYLKAVSDNTKNGVEIQKLANLLRERCIDAVFLKGAVASEVIFGDPGLYRGSDIDILVRPGHLDIAKRVLTEYGYSFDRQTEKAMRRSHYHLSFSDSSHFVEVHWDLVMRYFTAPPGLWWEETSAVMFHGEELLCLSPERYLLYLIFRLFSHSFSPLKFLVLASELIRKYRHELDWERFFHLSKITGMGKLATFTLVLMNDLLDTPLPEKMIKRKLPMYNFLTNALLHGLFREDNRPHIRKILLLMLLESPLKIPGAIIRRFIPGKEELRLRYRLPEKSGKIWLYYFLNPMLLFFLIFRKDRACRGPVRKHHI